MASGVLSHEPFLETSTQHMVFYFFLARVFTSSLNGYFLENPRFQFGEGWHNSKRITRFEQNAARISRIDGNIWQP